ncbi:Protein of unknown function [Bacillus mycoides]|nr:Protein of unknown function [Bacillus mycoides]
MLEMVSLFGLGSATFSEFKKTAIDRFERIQPCH